MGRSGIDIAIEPGWRCRVLEMVAQQAAFGQFHGRSMSLAQTGQVLRVSRRTVYYLIKSGRLHTVRTALGSQRVLLESVKDCWLERG
jgi:excisionase family DNA binding protein